MTADLVVEQTQIPVAHTHDTHTLTSCDRCDNVTCDALRSAELVLRVQTYARPVRVEKVSGIVPDSWLLDMSRLARLEAPDQTSGMEPISWLLASDSCLLDTGQRDNAVKHM